MGREKVLYKSEMPRTLAEVSDFLRQLAQWLEGRRIAFGEGEQQTVIEIPEQVVLEIKIEEEGGGLKRLKRSLEVEIEWMEGEAAAGSIGPAPGGSLGPAEG